MELYCCCHTLWPDTLHEVLKTKLAHKFNVQIIYFAITERWLLASAIVSVDCLPFELYRVYMIGIAHNGTMTISVLFLPIYDVCDAKYHVTSAASTACCCGFPMFFFLIKLSLSIVGKSHCIVLPQNVLEHCIHTWTWTGRRPDAISNRRKFRLWGCVAQTIWIWNEIHKYRHRTWWWAMVSDAIIPTCPIEFQLSRQRFSTIFWDRTKETLAIELSNVSMTHEICEL